VGDGQSCFDPGTEPRRGLGGVRSSRLRSLCATASVLRMVSRRTRARSAAEELAPISLTKASCRVSLLSPSQTRRRAISSGFLERAWPDPSAELDYRFLAIP
jgi:hypothetical protein